MSTPKFGPNIHHYMLNVDRTWYNAIVAKIKLSKGRNDGGEVRDFKELVVRLLTMWATGRIKLD